MATKLAGATEYELDLESSAHSQIPNSQTLGASSLQPIHYQLLVSQYGPRVIPRTPPLARYNCHGLTFAGRRTAIVETSVVSKILVDDSYSQISLDDVLPGDIILYYGEDGDIEHSGIVIVAPSASLLRIPKIVSKWGMYAELLHYANDCPYNFGGAKYFRIT